MWQKYTRVTTLPNSSFSQPMFWLDIYHVKPLLDYNPYSPWVKLLLVGEAAGDCQIFYNLGGTCVIGKYNSSELVFLGNNSGLIQVGVQSDSFVKETMWKVTPSKMVKWFIWNYCVMWGHLKFKRLSRNSHRVELQQSFIEKQIGIHLFVINFLELIMNNRSLNGNRPKL